MTTPLTDEQRRLAAEHWPAARRVAAWYAARFRTRGIDFEGVVAVALCQAALSHERGRRSFRSHAFQRVKGACLDALRANRVKGFGRNRRYEGAPAVTSLSARVGLGPEEGTATLADVIASGELPVGWEVDSADAVERLAARLPPRYARVVRLRFLGGLGIREAAEAMGVTESGTTKAQRVALDMLREAV